MPDFRFEERAWADGYRAVAGIDEAGRGPLAGPVIAAAVIFRNRNLPPGVADTLDDSKKLTAKRREALFAVLPEIADIGVGSAEVAEIDEINILQATMAAMQRAVAALPVQPDHAIVDGNRAPALPCPAEPLVKGDALCFSIAAASVVAKVTRDHLMCELAREFPAYGWERNCGYGTREHCQALATSGVTKHHRKSFAPVNKMLSPLLI